MKDKVAGNSGGYNSNNTEHRRKKRSTSDKKKHKTLKNDKEDLSKTTFSVKKLQSTIKEHIAMFQKFANGDDCVFGSRRCSTHNTKLVMSVVKKRVCSVSEKG